MVCFRFPVAIALASTVLGLVPTSPLQGADLIPTLWAHVAGNRAMPGYVDGMGEAVRFNNPRAIDMDAAGNLFVADVGNHVIRKITPGGDVTTFETRSDGSGWYESPGDLFSFTNIRQLEFAPNGDLYVLDGSRICRVRADGQVTTITRGPPGSSLQEGPPVNLSEVSLYDPHGLAIDAAGNLYVALTTNFAKITPDGKVSVWLSSSSPGINTSITPTADLQVGPDGQIYFVTAFSGRLFRSTPAGVVTEIVLDRSASGFSVSSPTQLDFAPDGALYVAGDFGQTVYRIDANGRVESVVPTSQVVSGSLPFRLPTGVVCAPNGDIILTDGASHSIQRIATDGTLSVIAGVGFKARADGPLAEVSLGSIGDIATDGQDAVYVTDRATVRRIDLASGVVTTVAGDLSAPAGVAGISGLVVGPGGVVYAVGAPKNVVSKLNPGGGWSIVAGKADSVGYQDGTGAAARFGSLDSITVDAAGNLYVLDGSPNYVIRKITPTGVVSTLAGQAGVRTLRDGKGVAAAFASPLEIAMGPDGTLWVAEWTHVRLVSPSGVVTTLAGGNDMVFPPADGVGAAAGFDAVSGIAVAPDGTAYITERAWRRIRVVTRDGRVRTLAKDSPLFGLAGSTSNDGIAIDGQGHLFVIDRAISRVLGGLSIESKALLANLSVLKNTSTLTAGFVLGGSGTGTKPMLMRAVGPSLARVGVESGFMADPVLRLFGSASELIDQNDNWVSSPPLLASTSRLGAFDLNTGSRDAVLLRDFGQGLFTATASAATGGAGAVLMEVYDGELREDLRLVNVSTLTRVGAGDQRLIAGFVLSGTGNKTILIRGAGPSLTQFGMGTSDVLGDPRLVLYSGGNAIGSNDDWNGDALVTTAAGRVGAFPLLSADSRDAALLVRLAPGPYTVHVESADGGAGQAIVEVYEVQ